MTTGIDASRAFLKKRTGIEEYSFQVIKHLAKIMKDRQVVLYVSPTNYEILRMYECENWIPSAWKIKIIKCSRFWTQVGLSWEMFQHPVDTLFVPAHTVPLIHPKNTVVTIHGLEYEIVQRAYSFLERLYMRFFIKNSCRWAKKIIAVSENTKKDLVRLYKVPEEKIEVIHEGYEKTTPSRQVDSPLLKKEGKGVVENYLLFIGRIEERKNIAGILEAFEILKEKYQIPHQLVLVGKPGHGYEDVEFPGFARSGIAGKIQNSKFQKDIVELGYVSDEKKFELLRGADVFLFPSFYEGFGLPILEAQSVGTPVVSSNVSSMPEVAGNSALLVDPRNSAEIAEAVQEILSDKNLKDDIIEKGRENVKRFSWEKCADQIAILLNG